MPDVIDLTENSPSPTRGGEGGSDDHRKQKRSHSDTVNLADEEEDGDEEQRQRQRIMQFAATAARSRQRTNAAASLEPSSSLAAAAINNERLLPSRDEEAAARSTIMAHAAAVNASRATQPSNNNLLAQLHAERLSRYGAPPAATAAPQSSSGPAPSVLKILSYNVWFREDLAVEARMTAISEIIGREAPTVICLQEVTPLIYRLLNSAPWWRQYVVRPTPIDAIRNSYFTVLMWQATGLQGPGGASAPSYSQIPFENSIMGRDLKMTSLRSGGLGLRVATSHLESPTGARQLYSAPRQAQCAQAVKLLDSAVGDVVFIGDLNWSEKNDGAPPLPNRWVDAWPHIHGTADVGYTYDGYRNAMLGRGPRSLRLRLDRAFCKLQDWELVGIEMVGTEAIAGAVFSGKPVLPSDHYGLVVTLRGKEGGAGRGAGGRRLG